MDEVRKQSDSINEEFQTLKSGEELPDSQLESRFNKLSLAFKTDRQTVEKRLGIQEHSRDLAEQNVDKELQSLKEAVKWLQQPNLQEDKAQEVIRKLGHHVDILEHSVARVISRAEVLGAVQQEKRMCMSMEVMITYTENIRRLRDREQHEVENAKKVLVEKRMQKGRSLDNLSITGLINSKAFRRRSEVVAPRSSGLVTSGPNLSPASELTQSSDFSKSSDSCGCRQSSSENEEPKQKPLMAGAVVTVRNVVTNSFRHPSLERQKRFSFHSSSSSFDTLDDRPQEIKEEEKDQAEQSQNSDKTGLETYEQRTNPTNSEAATQKTDPNTKDSIPVSTTTSTTCIKPTPKSMARMDTSTQHDNHPSTKEPATLKDLLTQHVQLKLTDSAMFPSELSWRHLSAGVIFLFGMAVLVVTFAFSSNMTSN